MRNILVVLILTSMLFSCGKSSDSDKVGDAQMCLDNYDPAKYPVTQVDTCVADEDGVTTTAAEGVRCSGGFIREGFSTGTRLVDASAAIDSGTGSSNTEALLGLLSFTSHADLTTDTSYSYSTFNSCLDSGSKGATLFASFSYFSMSLMTYFNAKANEAGGTPADCPSSLSSTNGYNYYDLSSCVTAATQDAAHILYYILPLVTDTSADTDAITAQSGIGAVLIGAYEVACTGSGANESMCTLLDTAITDAGGTSNPRTVAVKFFTGALSLP